MDLTNISPMSPLSIIRLIAFHWIFYTISYLAGLCPTPRRLSGSDSYKLRFFICDQFFFLNLAYLLDDEILYRHYQKGDTSAIATRVEEALNLFSQELHSQATANWIYDIRSELTTPPENEE